MGISLYTSKGKTCFWPLKFHSIGYKLRERNSDSPPQNSAMWKKAGKTLWDNRDSTSKQQLPKIKTSQCNSNCKELLNDARNLSVLQFRCHTCYETFCKRIVLHNREQPVTIFLPNEEVQYREWSPAEWLFATAGWHQGITYSGGPGALWRSKYPI